MCTQPISLSAMNLRAAGRSRSRLTLISTKFLSLNLRKMSSRLGTSTRQGGHQVAQKSSSTTLPLRSDSFTAWPLMSLRRKSGGVRPDRLRLAGNGQSPEEKQLSKWRFLSFSWSYYTMKAVFEIAAAGSLGALHSQAARREENCQKKVFYIIVHVRPVGCHRVRAGRKRSST